MQLDLFRTKEESEIIEDYGIKAITPCKKCGEISSPLNHGGCQHYKDKNCNWYISKE